MLLCTHEDRLGISRLTAQRSSFREYIEPIAQLDRPYLREDIRNKRRMSCPGVLQQYHGGEEIRTRQREIPFHKAVL